MIRTKATTRMSELLAFRISLQSPSKRYVCVGRYVGTVPFTVVDLGSFLHFLAQSSPLSQTTLGSSGPWGRWEAGHPGIMLSKLVGDRPKTHSDCSQWSRQYQDLDAPRLSGSNTAATSGCSDDLPELSPTAYKDIHVGRRIDLKAEGRAKMGHNSVRWECDATPMAVLSPADNHFRASQHCKTSPNPLQALNTASAIARSYHVPSRSSSSDTARADVVVRRSASHPAWPPLSSTGAQSRDFQRSSGVVVSAWRRSAIALWGGREHLYL